MLENVKPNKLLENARNRFKYKDWIFQPVDRIPNSYEFDCGVPEINTFFTHDSFVCESLRLTKTYELATEEILEDDLPPLAFISYCNDNIKLNTNTRNFFTLPNTKGFLKNLPAVKITWLAVSKDSHRNGAGLDMLDITKLLFASNENRTGCCVITVDAMNFPAAIGLYRKAGFRFVKESNAPVTNPDQKLYPMFFDLLGDWEYDSTILMPINTCCSKHE